MKVEHQVAIIFCGTKGLLKDVPVNKITDFQADYIHHLETNHADTMKTIAAGKYTDEITKVLTDSAALVSERFK